MGLFLAGLMAGGTVGVLVMCIARAGDDPVDDGDDAWPGGDV